MLIVIDIGNTNITMGLVDNNEIIDNYRLTTKLERTSDEYGFMLLSFLNASNIDVKEIEDVIEIIKNTLQGLREDEEVYISVEVIKHGKNKVE